MIRAMGSPFPLSLVIFATSLLFSTSIVQAKDDDKSPEKIDYQLAPTEKLIDNLTTVSEFGVGFHPTAWASGFVGADEEPTFGGGILGSKKPSVHPAMKSLVQRGVKALPQLIAHLSDERKTKISISARGFAGGTWHSDEYAPRYKDKKKAPKEVNTDKKIDVEEEYFLCVGDLCYVVIGQIVNRRFNAVRYQPSGNYVINSPVVTPKLAEVLKREWAGLTAEDHKQSLITDAENPFWGAPPPALSRLSFYYPAAAEKVAAKLLARQLYDNDVVWDFIQDKLIIHTTMEDWQKLIGEFREQHGKNVADSIPYWLHWIYWNTHRKWDAMFLKEQKIAQKILDTIYPGYDVESPPIFNAAEFDDQVSIVQAVKHLKSPTIDEAAHQLFLSALAAKLAIPEKLALLNVERLKTREKLRPYRPYIESHLKQLKSELTRTKDNADSRDRYESSIMKYEKILSLIDQSKK